VNPAKTAKMRRLRMITIKDVLKEFDDIFYHPSFGKDDIKQFIESKFREVLLTVKPDKEASGYVSDYYNGHNIALEKLDRNILIFLGESEVK
jgi:hypothetical protein